MEFLKEKNYDFKKAKEFFENHVNFTISPFELKKIFNNKDINKINLIDVRLYEDYIDGHIPFAEHVPFEGIDEHINMFEKEKCNIIYCYNEYCNLAQKAAMVLAEKNYPTRVLLGGIRIWRKYEYETVKTSSDD